MTVIEPHRFLKAVSQKLSAGSEFVPDISHELRTPLTAIQGALELLQSGQLGTLSEKERRMVEIAASNTERLLRLAVAIEQTTQPSLDVLSATQIAQLRLENDLRSALMHQQFQLAYQPIIELTGGDVVGFEALLRWHHPYLGVIPPLQFIPLAEANGLIISIGAWVIEQACRQLRDWQIQFASVFDDISVSVNLSSQQLADPKLASQIEQTLQRANLAPPCLRLEITESAIIQNSGTAYTILEQLRSLGIRIYVDDFGTGYSSLARLHELPLDALKIDRSFIQQIHDPKGICLVRAVIALAHNLGLDVIAEGIETADQIDQLQACGCFHGQGYAFARPLSAAAAALTVYRA